MTKIVPESFMSEKAQSVAPKCVLSLFMRGLIWGVVALFPVFVIDFAAHAL